MGGECSAYGGEERSIQGFGGETRGKDNQRPLERPRHRWDDNIKMDLHEVGCGGMDWIELVHDRERWRALEKCRSEPSGSIKCGEFLDWLRIGYLLKKDSAPWSK